MAADMRVMEGEIILITSGEYSDFGMIALTRAVQTFDPEALFAKAFPDGGFGDTVFGDWLIANGYLEKFKYRELYLDGYRHFNLSPTEK